jgi:formylglycine-generating enzyme required for sulfatase activity
VLLAGHPAVKLAYNGAPADGCAVESGICPGHVARGGAWDANPTHLRSAARFVRYFAYSFVAFRVAREAP